MLQAAIGSILRALLASIGGFFVQRGWWTQGELTDYIAGFSLFLIALLWSLWEKYGSRIKFLTALQAPKGSTEVDVLSKIADGRGATAAEVLAKTGALVLILVLAGGVAGCATNLRHISTVSAVAAHSTLAALQDTEMLLACDKPGAPAPPACVPTDLHREISAKLVTAFDLDIQAATTIRDWPALGPPPTSLGALLGQITVIANYILDHLPPGLLTTKLLTQIGAAK